MNYSKLLLRSEDKPGERRAPLTPLDAIRLRETVNLPIFVESSKTRAFADSLYELAGCQLVPPQTWKTVDSQTLVLGLKETSNEPDQMPSDHIYFSHSYRGQHGADQILKRFSSGSRKLFDLEYIVDDQGRRKVAFGYWAGYVGAALGILDYYEALPTPLTGFSSKGELLQILNQVKVDSGKVIPSVCITGAHGRAGRGAATLLDDLRISNFGIDLHNLDLLHQVREHQVLIHCVGIRNDEAIVSPLLNENELDGRYAIRHLVDVTCDYTSKHHRFPFYQTGTTLHSPMRQHQELRLIAVDHLPTLLPVESSEEFSAQLLPLLVDLLGAKNLDQLPEWRRSLPEANR